MFEKLISDALNQHLGAFIENIDSAQLGTSIYRGSLLLNNMRLKPTMFDSSPVPFQLKYGQIGRIYLKLPIWDMFASPLICEIEDVVGLVQIKPMALWDDQQQKEAFVQAQQHILDQFEIYIRQLHLLEETQKEDSKSGPAKYSFTQKLVDRILNNLQIRVKNVYFRFEDKMMVPSPFSSGNAEEPGAASSSQFAIGCKLKEFAVFTCDQDFKRVEDHSKVQQEGEKKHLTYKKVVIQGFSIFCDWEDITKAENGGIDVQKLREEQQMLGDDPLSADSYFMKILNGEFSDKKEDLIKHKNIIDNFYVELQLQLNKNIQKPSMPATLSFPYIKAKIIIGSGARCDAEDATMTFSIYQPQIIRILKTLEIIGFFNEFTGGALACFYNRKLTDKEAEEYLQLYQEWHCLVQEPKPKESQKQRIQTLRAQMLVYEKQVVGQTEIIDIRQVALKKIENQEGRQKELDELEQKIQEAISSKLGFGWFTGSEEKKAIEKEVRESFQAKMDSLLNKYNRQAEKLSDDVKKLIEEFKQEGEQEQEGDLQLVDVGKDKKSTGGSGQSFNHAYNQLPGEYMIIKIDLDIQALNFTVDNEFDQRILLMRLEEFCVIVQYAKKFIKAQVTVRDFYVKDLWSGSKPFEHLAYLKPPEAKHHGEAFDQKAEDGSGPDNAVSISYEANEDFGTCPFHIDADFSKQLYIVATLPLVLELQRTIDVAFENEKLDFKFYKRAATGRIKELREQAEETAKELMEQSSKNAKDTGSKSKENTHINVSLDFKLNAPVIVVPENIFDEKTIQVELHLGTAHIRSHLVDFNKKINYKDILDEELLYDVYELKFHGLCLKIKDPELSGEAEQNLIKDISSQIDIYHCLDHLHPLYPSIKIDQNFSQSIEFILELRSLSQIFRLQNSLMLQLGNQEFKYISQSMKKKRKDEARNGKEGFEEVKQQLVQAISAQYQNQVNLMRRKSVMQKKLSQGRDGAAGGKKDSKAASTFKRSEASRLTNRIGSAQTKSVKFDHRNDHGSASGASGSCSSSSSFNTDSDASDLDSDNNENTNDDGNDFNENLSIINTSNTRIKRLNTMSQGFSQLTYSTKKTDMDIEFNFNIKNFMIKIENNLDQSQGQSNTESMTPMLMFVMKELSTQIILENKDFQDIAVDMSVQTLQIKEENPGPAGAEPASATGSSQKNFDSCELFQKIVSSPIDDYISIAKEHASKKQKAAKSASSQHPSSHCGDQQAFYQKRLESELQLQVQIFLKTQDIYDSSTQLKISKKEMDIACIINRTRIIYNIPTIMNIMKMQKELDKLLASQQRQQQGMRLDKNMLILKVLAGQSSKSDEAEFQAKIYTNLAAQFGNAKKEAGESAKQESIEKFLLDCASCSCHGIYGFIEKIQLTKKKMQEDASQNQKIEMMSDEELNERKFQCQQIQKDIQKKPKAGRSMVSMFQQGSLMNTSVDQMFEQSAEAEPKLYVIKIEPQEYVINLKVKLKNMEMWVADYQGQKNQRAQILQLEFMADFFMDSDQFSRYITSSKKVPPRNVIQDSLARLESQPSTQTAAKLRRETTNNGSIEDVSVNVSDSKSLGMIDEDDEDVDDEPYKSPENLVHETKILTSNSSMQINLTRLHAQQTIVSKWGMVQNIIWQLFDRQYRSENPQQFAEADDELKREDYNSGSGSSDYSGPPMNYKDFGSDGHPLRSSDSELSDDSDGHGEQEVMFSQSKILQPTGISILMVNNYQHKKISFSNTKLDIDTLFLKLDFKDIDMLYTIMTKNTSEMQKLFPQTPTEDQRVDLEQSERKSEQNSQDFQRQQAQDLSQTPNKAEKTTETQAASEDFKTIVTNTQVKIKSIVLSLSDGDYDHFNGKSKTMPMPLLEFCLSELSVNMKGCDLLEKQMDKNPFMAMTITEFLERYHNGKAFLPPYNKLEVNIQMYATYYNQLSQAFEPFLEPWSLEIEIQQQDKDDLQDIKIFSKDFMNLNITYGMALNIMEVKTKIEGRIEKINERIKDQPGKPQMQLGFDDKDKSDRDKKSDKNTSQAVIEKADRQNPLPLSINPPLMARKTRIIDADSYNQSHGHKHDQDANEEQNSSGYKFYNYTGTMIKFCITDDELNEELRLPFQRQDNCGLGRKSNLALKFDKVMAMEGDSINQKELLTPVFRDHSVLEAQLNEIKRKRQKNQFAGTQDFIEDEALTIDLKITGIQKLHQIPIERVGVHSYKAEGLCQVLCDDLSIDEMKSSHQHHSDEDGASMQLVSRPIGLIVNVKTQGRKRIINFESQLLIANNLVLPITLVFKIKQINQNSQEILEKKERGDFQENENMNMQASHAKETKQMMDDMLLDESKIEEELEKHPDLENQRGLSQYVKELSQQVKIVIQPNDIYRVPLIWLMQDSRIDMFIQAERKEDDDQAEEQELLELYTDIQNLFNQCAGDKQIGVGIQSKLIEMNDDFYSSVDIQGYKCLSSIQKASNPLQYVMSFNPPLMLSNLTFSPLELIEIDNPCTPQFELKTQAKIPPKMSEYIVTLDLSQDNNSWIRFVFSDRQKNLMISSTIDKFFKSDFGFYDYESEKSSKKSQKSQANEEGDQVIDELTKPNIKGVKFYRHSTPEEYNEMETADGEPLEVMQVHMETVRKIFTDLKAYNENFQFRERIFDKSNAVKIMLYPKYIIVNKTKKALICEGQVIQGRTNDYLMYDLSQQRDEKGRKTYKIQFEVAGFRRSEVIDLNHIGTSGVIHLDSIDPVHDFRQLQFGISIALGPVPFNKTTIITVVPRYVICNKLEHPIMIRQACGDQAVNKNDKKRRTHQYLKVDHNAVHFQENLHLMRSHKNLKNVHIEDNIQFRILTPNEYDAPIDELEESSPENDPYWCLPFCVDHIEDFQTEQKLKGLESPKEQDRDRHRSQIIQIDSGSEQKLDPSKQWFEPQDYNQWNLFTRVIVTMNPTDNDSTILIIFDEPQYEEFIVKNRTDFDLSYCKFDQLARKPLTMPFKVFKGHKSPFVWNNREKTVKTIQIQIENQTMLISLDKCTENNNKEKLFKNREYIFYATVRLSTEGTKIVNVTQEQRKKNENNDEEDQDEEQKRNQQHISTKKEGSNIEIGFKGFGISFIDNKPQELLYVCLDEVDIKFNTCTFKVQDDKDITENQVEFWLDIGNFQIDNLINEEMPVLLGSKDYYDNNLIIAGKSKRHCGKYNLAHSFRLVEEADLKQKERDKDGNELERLPFLKSHVIMSKKTQEHKLGEIVRYESIYFGMQEFFIRVETTILNDNIKFLIEVMDVLGQKEDGEILASEEEYERQLLQSRDQTCPQISAAEGIVFDEKQLKFDKISFGIIMLGTIKADLTFKLQKRAFDFDFSNPRAVGGSLSQMNPFITNFASISDANLQLNELVIIEGFFSQQQLIRSLMTHYMTQGKREVLKVLGSSDMLGNPVGLFNKIGVGFVELRREPAVGMRQGTSGFLKGLGKGLGSVIKGVVGGTFDSVSTLSGSLYLVIKESTWGEDSRDERAANIGQGLVYGVKGIGVELYQGVGGVFTKPYQGAKSEGFKGFSKGVGKGLVGLVVTPVTATLRVGQSVSQGISGTANDLGNLGKTKMELMDTKKVRIRPPRRIDVRNQIKVFDEDLAIINRLLNAVNDGFFSDQQIRFYAVLPTITAQGQVVNNKKSLIIVTNGFLIYMQIFNFVDFLKEKNQKKTLLLSEKLSNILNYQIKKFEHNAQESEVSESVTARENDCSGDQYFFTITFNRPMKKMINKTKIKEVQAEKRGSLKRKLTARKDQEGEDSDDIGESFQFSSSQLSDKSEESNCDIENQMGSHRHGSRSMSQRPDPAPNQNEMMAPLINKKQATFVEERDREAKYQFVMYSPSLEIFKRMHHIFNQLPEIVQNIEKPENAFRDLELGKASK